MREEETRERGRWSTSSMRETPPLKLKDDPGNRCGDKWHFDGNLSALSDLPPPSYKTKVEAERTVVDEGVDSANAESRR